MSAPVTIRALFRAPVLAALLAPASSALADHGPLNGDQIKDLMVGHTASGVSSRNGKRWYADYAADGSYVVRVPASDWSTRGTWRIEGDLWCTERPQRSERCKQIEHVAGDEYHAVDDRRETLEFRIER